MALPDQVQSGEVPEWIQLLPTGTVQTNDGRGPYSVPDAARLASESLAAAGGRLAVDENHATDLAAPKGEPAPARGWIVSLQARADGIWGKVDWTAAGRALVADKAYRFISPVIRHLADGTVTGILRASLVNAPNLRGMAALHQEKTMDLLAKLREALGLKADADEAAALAAIGTLKSTVSTHAVTIAGLAKAAGLKEDAEATALLVAVTGLADTQKGKLAPEIVALQAELVAVTGELKTLKEAGARGRAEAFVDGAIRDGRVGVKPLREHYVARHMIDAASAAAVEKEIAALPKLSGGAIIDAVPPADRDGKVALNAEQQTAARLLGIPVEEYRKTLAAERQAAL
jgi:phage I-like protein